MSNHTSREVAPSTQAPDDLQEAALPTNWGRWGTEDQLGTLNLINDAARARAAQEARTGRTVSLAVPVRPAPVSGGPFTQLPDGPRPVQQALMFTGTPPMGMSEVLIVTPHDPGLTHLDAVAHLPVDGRVYPGKTLDEAVSLSGVAHGSTSAFAEGIVTRGVLLDLAPGTQLPGAHPVTGADLDAAETRGGVLLEAGDALVVRTGWSATWDAGDPSPGMSVDAVEWMRCRDVSLYAGDVGDAFPPLSPDMPMPLHMVGLARLGMPLVDGAAVDELTTVCAELARTSFMLAIAPMRIHGLTGVPVNPLAIF